ncbi:MAG TPA: acetyl-CoA carboxylase carboxyl transferase subunit alpha [Ruminococcaceae bacterium]|nr:acetyl-CoA carboxylase carboxyl transferase subunit alpha [Oscillospiraceae bacterium]
MPKTPWERLKIARMMERPTSQYYIRKLFTDFIELHGDRGFADDGAVMGGVAFFDGRPVTVITEEKGRDIAERQKRNFGSPHPEGYRKALRLMKQADKFGRPVICLVDTQGAYCGTGAEERGQGEAIATNLKEMMALKVPVISVVIGEGGSGGALAVAVANRVAMLENAVYSVLSPEGFAAILWKDAGRAEEAAGVMKITAEELLQLKIIEDIIPEPEEGAQSDPKAVCENIKRYLKTNLDELLSITPEELAQQRYLRFRGF